MYSQGYFYWGKKKIKLIYFLLRREKNKQICCHRLRGHPSFLEIAYFQILATKWTHNYLQIYTGFVLCVPLFLN